MAQPEILQVGEQLRLDIPVEPVVLSFKDDVDPVVSVAQLALEVAEVAYSIRLQHFPTRDDEIKLGNVSERELLHGRWYLAGVRLSTILTNYRRRPEGSDVSDRVSRIEDYKV